MIDVEQLTYSYPRASTSAITGLNFTIAPGEIFGFLGPSGAGKSTTQNILIGLCKGYKGSVKVFERELKRGAQIIMSISAFRLSCRITF